MAMEQAAARTPEREAFYDRIDAYNHGAAVGAAALDGHGRANDPLSADDLALQ